MRTQFVVAGITDFVITLIGDEEPYEVTSGPRDALLFDRAHREETEVVPDRERLLELALTASKRAGRVDKEVTFDDWLDLIDDVSIAVGDDLPEEEEDPESGAPGSGAGEPASEPSPEPTDVPPEARES